MLGLYLYSYYANYMQLIEYSKLWIGVEQLIYYMLLFVAHQNNRLGSIRTMMIELRIEIEHFFRLFQKWVKTIDVGLEWKNRFKTIFFFITILT